MVRARGSRLLPPLLLPLLPLLLEPLPPARALSPRVSLPLGSEERRILRFEAENISNYTALLLSQDGATLYVGARGALFALNSNLSFLPSGPYQELLWPADTERKQQCSFKGKDPKRDCQNYIKILLPLNGTHLFTCGTAAFSPLCTYINVANFTLARDAAGNVLLEDGKGRCPFDPNFKSTALVVDGELYTGTVSSFQGNDPAIARSQSPRPTKTESSLNWLQDPAFVASAHIPESVDSPQGDDDKIYFFFSETGQEFEFFGNTIVSRVARVCKGDEGGERVLQQRWTSFLKAQLLCTRPEDGFPFNVLQDVFTLRPAHDWRRTLFYGVFTSQWHRGPAGGSAVCVFSMEDVRRAFEGLYKKVNRETQQWYTETYPAPVPRPGACITNSARERKINSSLQLPDRVLNFLKDHFLMDGQVRSRMLLLQPQARYQRVAVHRVPGLHRTYDVLFLGTGDGRLHKAVSVGPSTHIIEELQIFPPGQPVQNLLLDGHKGLLYASSHSGVVQVPVANCSLYSTCGDCLLARDPYCAWDGTRCRHVSLYQPEPASRPWVQDVEGANAKELCKNASAVRPRSFAPAGKPCEQVQVQPNTVNTLACPLLSNLATRLWLYDGAPVNACASCRVLPSGDLLLVGGEPGLGPFQCWALEGGVQQLVASYCPEVPEDGGAGPGGRAPMVISTSRVSAPAVGAAGWGAARSYWTEFLVMCALFGLAVVLLMLFFLYRHRGGMKAFLKQGECASVHPKTRPVVLPPETRPLNGVGPPSLPPDHRGYQALWDSAPGPLGPLESEKRPLSIQDSFVEVSPVCPRPRVRLGSEIRDSVV